MDIEEIPARNEVPMEELRRLEEEEEREYSVMVQATRNQAVLETLFKVCPVSYTQSLRFVCKDWFDASLKPFRTSAILTVGENRKIPQSGSMITLRELISRAENPDDEYKLSLTKNFHFCRYKLFLWYLTYRNLDMVKFWNYYTHTITYLELWKIRVDQIATLEQVLYSKIPNCKTLILDQLFLKTSRTSENPSCPPNLNLRVLRLRHLMSFPIEWTVFLSHFPKIQELEVTDFRTDDVLARVAFAISTIRMDDRGSLDIKSLAIIRGKNRTIRVDREFPHALRRTLASCDLNVEELFLKLGSRTYRHTARETLMLWALSLKKLEFHIDFSIPEFARMDRETKRQYLFPYSVEFPKLEAVTIYQWCRPYPAIGRIVRSAPKVKSIKFEASGSHAIWHDMKLLPSANYARRMVKWNFEEFSFRFVSLRWNLFGLPVFAPNLTKLEARLDNYLFGFVCARLPNLVELRVDQSRQDLTDGGITGLDDADPEAEVPIRPNITSLRRLRVFVLLRTKHFLTSKSVFHGFLKVPKLFTLEMTLPPDQISGNARRALEAAIPNLVVLKKGLDAA